MGKMKKKYESGAATAYIGRNQAIKKLQLTLADFRRLCIMKGIFPIAPKNKKSKQGEFKTYVKRLRRAEGRREKKNMRRLRENKPFYRIDHIVKERYPTFMDAIRDMDDCLSLVFMFAILPKSKRVYVERIQACRQLSLEFLHFVIASQSLRKCFISIKGYYFQAEVYGHKVTWMMPHRLAYQNPDDVDFRIMATFVEFYTVMLGFTNFKLYQDIGLFYPPKLSLTSEDKEKLDKIEQTDMNDEYLASLNCDFIKIAENLNKDEVAIDEFPANDDPDCIDKIKLEEEKLKKLKNLFKGLKFFLNREIPREQFVFVLRSFCGQVSWDNTTSIGSTYQEDDETITHQIIDRPLTKRAYLNRVYVQPQWVFDCVNAGILLPVEEYLPGATLPPHLSPFVEVNEGDYVPPEGIQLMKLQAGEAVPKEIETQEDAKSDNESAQESDDEEEKLEEVEVDQVEDELDKEGEIIEETKIKTKENGKKIKEKKVPMEVKRGIIEKPNVEKLVKKQQDEEKRLNEMMIPKKHKRLYNKIMFSKKKKNQEVEKLREKRKAFEEQVKVENKKKKIKSK